MKKIITTLLLIGCSVIVPIAMADINKAYQQDITLPDQSNTTTQEIEGVNKLVVTFKNLVPALAEKYKFSVNSKRMGYPFLKFPAAVPIAESTASQEMNIRNDCDAFKEAIKNLREATKESEVPDLKKQLRQAKLQYPECKKEVNAASLVLKATEQTILIAPVTEGNTYTIEVTRPVAGGEDLKWVYQYKYNFSSAWITHFGISFLQNKNRSYFTEKSTENNTNKFTIKKEKKNGDYVQLPTVMFTYLEKDKIGSKGVWAGTVGVGYDKSNPSVLGGISYVYGTNIMLTAGVAITRYDRLSGRYSEGQTLGSDKSSDDLKTTVYDHAAFISFSFRFDQSPFSTQ